MIARHDVKLSLSFVAIQMFKNIFNERLRFFIFFSLTSIGNVTAYQYLIDSTIISDVIHRFYECRF